MILVEFTGPPEVGKSRLATAILDTTSTSAPRWIDASLLRRHSRVKDVFFSDRWLARASRRDRLATLLFGAVDARTSGQAVADRAAEWSEFLSRACLPTNGSTLGLLAASRAVQAIETRAMIEDARPRLPTGTVALLDEGLTHPYKFLALLGSEDPGPERLLLDALPLPDVLVHVTADLETLVARLDARRRRYPRGPRESTWASDAAMREDAERTRVASGAIAAALAARGVPVLELDGRRDPAANAEEVVRGVRSLAETILS